MITPSAQQELACVLHSLKKQVLPAVYGTDAESPVATLTHILRHVNQRIEFEGQILFEDIATLRNLLPELRSFLLALGSQGAEQAAAIDRALAAEYCDANTYRSLAIMGKEALALRECLYNGLKLLQAVPRERRDAKYKQMRESIRRCVIWQTEQERRLIEPAFFGHGPRR
jgi:hypothetical protein